MFYMSLNAIIKFIVRDFPKKKNVPLTLNLYHDIQWFLKYKYMYMSDKIQFSDTFAYKGAIHTFAYLFILINDFKII